MSIEHDLASTERIRRDFAAAWGRIGAAWGVAPSTASVQGYLLLHGGPLTSGELQDALGLSHRATRTAIADCEAWGIIERAPQPRRGGSRGPAGTAWLPVGDHWEWFRRVAASRVERETDPVLPLLDACLDQVRALPDSEPAVADLRTRLGSLVEFTHRFDHAVDIVVRLDSQDIGRLFDHLDRIPDERLERLLRAVAGMPPDDVVASAELLAGLSPSGLRRLAGLARQPGVAKVLGATLGRGGRGH
jgi:DNA-binding transcriptional regulator GbsR (MarR family)